MKRQYYSQNEKTTLYSKPKDNTIVNGKRQHYNQNEKTTIGKKLKKKTQH
jgi:hypothetical protein